MIGPDDQENPICHLAIWKEGYK